MTQAGTSQSVLHALLSEVAHGNDLLPFHRVSLRLLESQMECIAPLLPAQIRIKQKPAGTPPLAAKMQNVPHASGKFDQEKTQRGPSYRAGVRLGVVPHIAVG